MANTTFGKLMQMRRCKSFLRPSNVSLNEKGFKIKIMFSIKQRNRTERTLQVLTNDQNEYIKKNNQQFLLKKSVI